MRAAWYDRRGEASKVITVGELPDPVPGPGEVRIRVHASGVNPGDVKKRDSWLGQDAMAYPRVVPHSDGAGVIDRTGPGVDPARVGERVWCFGAQSYRPFGTAAEYTTVPAWQAVHLPDHVGFDQGACLGIPGITAHRAVFADGPVAGRTVLVSGVLGAVGSIAAALAGAAGATVLGTVRDASQLAGAGQRWPGRPGHLVAATDPDAAERIREVAPAGVDRVVEVAFDANLALNTEILAVGAVLASYSTVQDRPELPFWPLLFKNVTLRLLGSDDFPAEARRVAAAELTDRVADGTLVVPVASRYPLTETAAAHQAVERPGGPGRVLVEPLG